MPAGEEHTKPILRKKPAAIIIHSRTNDITNGKPAKKKIREVVHLIEEVNADIQIIISGLTDGEDCAVCGKVSSINSQLETYCNSNFFFTF